MRQKQNQVTLEPYPLRHESKHVSLDRKPLGQKAKQVSLERYYKGVPTMHQAPKQGDPVLPIDNISVDFRRRDSESSALIETVIY